MMRTVWGSTVAAFVLAATLACASDQNEPPGDTLRAAPEAPPSAAAPAPAAPGLQLSTGAGAPGTKVTVSMGGLVLHEKVDVAFGGLVEYQVIYHDTASVDGEFEGTVTIPADTRPGTYYFFLADTDTSQPLVRPVPFLVTAGDGTASVSGTLTADGVECRALRTASGEVYTLTGAADLPPVGTEVTVQGTIAQQSTCQQGITIAVKTIRSR
jgi:hypothetical protein